MKRMLKIGLMLIFMLTLISGDFLFSKSKPKSKVRFFAPGSFYIYVMGSYNHFSPAEEHFMELGVYSSNTTAPVLGVGYRVVNIKNRAFFSLEFDYSPAKYNFGEFARNQKINLLTFMLSGEGTIMLKKFPLVVYAGMGVGIHQLSGLGYEDLLGDYINTGNDNITVLAMDVGFKIPISRNIFIRTEYQWNGEVYGDYEYYDEYWDDEYSNTEWDFLSSSFSVGLEIHF